LAIELTDGEWRSLVALLIELQEQHQRLVSQLMAEEAISIELERGVWWGELDGDRNSWSLSVVLTAEHARGAEGHWPDPAAAAMVAAMRTALDSNND
jgi:transposase